MSKLQVLNLVKGSDSLKLTLKASDGQKLQGGESVITDIYELTKFNIQFKVICMYLSGEKLFSTFICSQVNISAYFMHTAVVTISIGTSKVSPSSSLWTEIYQIKSKTDFEIDLVVSCALRDIVSKESNPLKSIYEDEKLLDFKIVVGKLEGKEPKSVGFHRTVLSAWSPVFMNMFTGSWKEKHEGEVELHLNIGIIEAFKKFIYKEELPTDHETLLGLIELGSYYMIPKLETDAIKALSDRTNTENFNEILEYSYVKKMNRLTAAMLMKFQSVDKNKLDLNLIVKTLTTPLI